MNKHPDRFTGVRATYRLQFDQHFTFRDVAGLVPYLATLGITHIYASSIMKARSGSPHGYHIIDHNQLNQISAARRISNH